ncbi:MAG TPA: malonyl-ACP O-methyltransferase BioC [Syntrophaceae bacterium]|nr:malonyl-ACP O-methyltransferase BioC [Syntrophaceae bacterium]
MPQMEYKEKIKRAFSRAATTYDKYADLQKEVAIRLLRLINRKDFSNILEVGCGTGNFTLILSRKFPEASITAVDFSAPMIEVASNKLNGKVRFLLCDGEDLYSECKFDLITSNATFQWFENLEKTINNYRNFLEERGLILFSILGPSTFYELKEVFNQTHPDRGINFPSSRFLSLNRLEAALKRSFKEVKIEEVIFFREYENIRELLKTIKYTGENVSVSGSGLFLTPSKIKKLEETYFKKFGGIRASYQTFFCLGVR